MNLSLIESSHEHLRDLRRNRNRCRHREGHADLHGISHSLLHEAVVKQERTLERGFLASINVPVAVESRMRLGPRRRRAEQLLQSILGIDVSEIGTMRA